MFNPKVNNLLDEQLAVSGLEMNIAGVFAGISAAASIAGGIMGSSEASKQNAAAKKAQKEQEKYNEKVAKLTNEHNDKLDAADKANYYAMRDYSYETSLLNWERGAEIQDFQYLQTLKEYQKSITLGNQNLGLTAQSAALGIEAEQAVISEFFVQQQQQHRDSMDALKQVYFEQNLNRQEQFQQLQGIRSRQKFSNLEFQNTVEQLMTQSALVKEAEMVKNLVSEGAVLASGQAGRSTAKAVQSNKANLHRGLMMLENEFSGKYKQAAVDIAQINADASLQEAGVGLNLQRIDQAIKTAERDTQYNINTLNENRKSAINQTLLNVKEISLQHQIADLNTKAGMMLFPERLSYDPVPEMPPEQIFVDRMEAIPGYVPPAQQQSTFAPLISGIGQAAGALSGIDFGGGSSGGGGSSTPIIGTSTNYFG